MRPAPRRQALVLGLVATLFLGASACSGDDSSSAAAPTSAAAQGAAPASATVSANDATKADIAAALEAAGVANAARWADEVVEYRPYDDAAEGFPHLREELQKYNPPAGTIDQIVAVLR